ncbi:MAG: myo-inositol 2-dehydrogenase [Aeromicrobium sp.]|uniref:Gfo/Idh/MocA family protein n=1 Tax=Aeromicrobium sp. TaxID=1871063 RepID=UPI002626DEBB|nr:Gfo/Idh/MocA family oxidoreductase [Aeromicrobium sp.]MCW2789013.1 myo-inositol 2-dehydrogenase [Aeromicrobium sp.]MCW2825559.1 myo-inositol 2-dehydrogenase [Aeromicrobium sp.]
MTTELRVGIVGFGWMGQVHARALSRLLQHYPDAPLRPRLVAVADNAPDDRTKRAADAYGFEHLVTDWRELVTHDEVDLVCVTGPNFIHRDVAVAAAEAGKHLWVEKPAGRDAAETAEIVAAVEAAGVQAAAGFNYRNVPAVERAREIVASGRIGTVEHTTVRFLADYSADPDAALSWRFQNQYAGSGVLGDLVSHAADLVQHVVAPIAELVVDRATFIPQRRAALPGAMHYEKGAGELGDVENEDYVNALFRLADGSRGILESSRTAVGEQNTYGFEVHGTTGAVAWDFRRMNELRVCAGQDYLNGFYATEYAGPGDGELSVFQPGTNNPIGFDDLKVVEARRLVESIATGKPVGATIRDALAAAKVVDAMILSSNERKWVSL